ncbi:MAG: transcription antitermination factor NusB [Actinobacteria bacterium]|nr:transcription antitermination factor NusB [Actinomycetota bacterium]MCL6104164.1 transcription antitermination factor NusB [Actinomycetota bacterium]
MSKLKDPALSTRHQAREQILALLYEAEIKKLTISDVLANQIAPMDSFATALLNGIEKNLKRIDEAIKVHSIGWKLERMPIVDLCIMRMAGAELLCCLDTSVAVIISEAVALSKTYSTAESGGFINGVLAQVAIDFRGA